MAMVSDDCLVECKIDDDSEDEHGAGEQINTPPPPPEFASKSPTPAPKAPAPPSLPAAPTCPVNRDPYGINKHLKVELGDVWLHDALGFETTRVWTYRCLTLLFAVPLAFVCGVFLALLACLHVWLLVPCIQLSNTFLPCLRSLFMCAVNVFISPLCLSFALCCSQIAISLSDRDPVRNKESV